MIFPANEKGAGLSKDASKTEHPWLAGYPEGVDWAEALPAAPLFALFDDALAKYPDNPCIDFLGKNWTYREIGGLIDRAAAGFKELGVAKGVKVGLCLPNTPYYVICYYAVLKTGGTLVNYNPLYAKRELAHQIADSQTSIMVTLDLKQIYLKVAAMLEESSLQTIIICPMSDILPIFKSVLFSVFKRSKVAAIPADDRHVTFAELTSNDGVFEPAKVDPLKDIALLQYTGGTTGTPKGAMLTHANLCANAYQVCRWFHGMEMGGERILGVLPLFHVFAMTVVMNTGIASGSELILLPRFEIKQVLETIDAKRPTLFPGVPTIYTAINASPGLSGYDLSSIKYCISGGAPLPAEVKRTFEALTGCTLVEGYGLSESSPVATCNPIIGPAKEGSIGLPLPATVIEIRDMNAPGDNPGKVVETGEKGEVCIAGPQVMAGYRNRPEETAAALADGFLHTGDVGTMDAQGHVFLIDRIKDLILCGGYNVYPRAVEEAIYLHPSVEEVTVIGIADDYRGQSPKAFVKLRDGEHLNEEELLAFLKDKLSPIEIPRHIEFRKSLPKTMIGKLSKKELAAEEQKT